MGVDMTQLDDAMDGSSKVITITFKDEAGDAVSPESATWSLTDGDGVVVNSREDVTISSPTATEKISLSGDDLLYSDGEKRYLVVEATYTSSITSTVLPLNTGVWFRVVDLPSV